MCEHAPRLAIPAIIYLKHAPRLGNSGSQAPLIWRSRLSYTSNTYLKHATHLATPAIIYRHRPSPPRLGDSGLSYKCKHAPHLAIRAIIYLKHARPVDFITYILNTPHHWAIPVYHTYLNTPLIWRFRLSYTLNTPPDWAIPVYHIYLNTPLIWRFRLPYTLDTPNQWGSSYILSTSPDRAIPGHHIS